MINMNLKILSAKQLRLLELCYCGILSTTDQLIEDALIKNIDPDETCEVPQSIRTIAIHNCAIATTIEVNNKNCTDPNIEW